MKKQYNLTIVLLIITQLITAQTKISQSKSELTSSSSSTIYRSYSAPGAIEPSGRASNLNYGDDMTFQELIVGGLVTVGALVSYKALIGSYSTENHLHNRLTAYPYNDRRFGNYTSIDSVAAKHNMRVDIENSIMVIDNDLFGNHLKIKLRPCHFLFLQADYHQLAEYNNTTDRNDYLALMGFNVGYDRLRFGRFNLGFTLGVNYIGNEVKKAAFSYGINTEAFIIKNISLNAGARFSKINHEPVNHIEVKGRYHMGRWYGTAGYEMLKIATPYYNFATVGVGIYL